MNLTQRFVSQHEMLVLVYLSHRIILTFKHAIFSLFLSFFHPPPLPRARASEIKFEYDKIPKSTVATRLKKEGTIKWQRQWESTDKGALCRSFFPEVEQRLQVNLPITPAFTAMVSGHGKTKSYLHRFGFIDSLMCPCKGGDQTPEHFIYHCNILETQRKIMIQRIKKSGGTWPITNKDLVAKYL